MVAYMYVLLPLQLELQSPDELRRFLPDAELVRVQLINFLAVGALAIGLIKGTGRARLSCDPGQVLPLRIADRLWWAGAGLGLVSVLIFSYTIAAVGGLGAAYGAAYGGGWADSGYVRDLVVLNIPAILSLFLARSGRPLRAVDWAVIALFALPDLTHGILGARRGPIFQVVATLVFGWFTSRGTRPPLLLVLKGGVVLGLFLLVLVTNRSAIHLGSDLELDVTRPLNLEASSGNEFIYGAGVILDAERGGGYLWLYRHAVTFLIRPIPRSIWETKYEDAAHLLGGPDMSFNAGNAGETFAGNVGWEAARGSAPGIVADLWVDFGPLALPALGLIGYLIAAAWRQWVSGSPFHSLMYGLILAFSLYLVAQTQVAFLLRFVECCAFAWLAWRYATWGCPGSLLQLSRRRETLLRAPPLRATLLPLGARLDPLRRPARIHNRLVGR
jgi:hypothetical protein